MEIEEGDIYAIGGDGLKRRERKIKRRKVQWCTCEISATTLAISASLRSLVSPSSLCQGKAGM